jgi:hypothetical protein
MCHELSFGLSATTAVLKNPFGNPPGPLPGQEGGQDL